MIINTNTPKGRHIVTRAIIAAPNPDNAPTHQYVVSAQLAPRHRLEAIVDAPNAAAMLQALPADAHNIIYTTDDNAPTAIPDIYIAAQKAARQAVRYAYAKAIAAQSPDAADAARAKATAKARAAGDRARAKGCSAAHTAAKAAKAAPAYADAATYIAAHTGAERLWGLLGALSAPWSDSGRCTGDIDPDALDVVQDSAIALLEAGYNDAIARAAAADIADAPAWMLRDMGDAAAALQAAAAADIAAAYRAARAAAHRWIRAAKAPAAALTATGDDLPAPLAPGLSPVLDARRAQVIAVLPLCSEDTQRVAGIVLGGGDAGDVAAAYMIARPSARTRITRAALEIKRHIAAITD